MFSSTPGASIKTLLNFPLSTSFLSEMSSLDKPPIISPSILCDWKYRIISSTVISAIMVKNTVIISIPFSFALLMAPIIYCIGISSTVCACLLTSSTSAALPVFLEDNAAAMVLGTNPSAVIAALTFSFVSLLTLG